MNANRIMTTHRAIQVSALEDACRAKASLFRRCAGKAADIGNRNAAIYWVNRAQKCDAIVMRCTLLLGRDHSARQRIKQAA
ncbi:hypothetical protein [Caudoviricetes sp.]|nr:hypothetical protein [Caudoviricetes sp.]